MEDRIITTKEVGNYRIKIYYDDYSGESPIINWDMCGLYFFEYSDTSRLHDECNWKTFFYNNNHRLRDVLEAIVVEHVKQEDIIKYLKEGKANNVSFIYNGSTHLWELRYESFSYVQEEFLPEDLEDLDYKTELIECLDDEDLLKIINEYEKDLLVIEWSTRGHSQGDYVEGIAYVTKDRYEKIYNEKENWKEDCAKIIDNEVKSIGMWMWGDVKGYVLEKKVAFTKRYEDESREDEDCEEWEEVDSCWGCYEETDELIKEVMIENGLEE